MKKIGLEKEFLVVNKEGRISNAADLLIQHHLNTGFIVPEASCGVVEVNSDPAASLAALEESLKEQLMTLNKIAWAHQLETLPLSEVGPDNALIARQGSKRYRLNRLFFGRRRGGLYRSLCGTHLHIDLEDNVAMQYNLLQSLDPLFVLLAATPFIRGRFCSFAARVSTQRFQVFQNKTTHGGLLGYVEHVEDVVALSQWQRGALIDSLRRQGISEALARTVYSLDNSAWGPLRLRERTLELRGCDANMLSLVLAFAAFVKGVNDYVFRNKLTVVVAQKGGQYGVNASEIVVPNYRELKRLERDAFRSGIRAARVYDYLSYLMQIAQAGLSEEDQHYLRPFQRMLATHRTMADVVYLLASTLPRPSPYRLCSQSARTINRFMAHVYHADLEGRDLVTNLLDHGLGAIRETLAATAMAEVAVA